MKSFSYYVFRHSFSVVALITAVKLIATIKELFVAYYFGTSGLVDAFLIAYMIPAFITNVIIDSFNAGMIPRYIDVLKNQSPLEAQRLSATINLISAISLFTVSLVIGGGISYLMPIFASGFDSNQLHLTLMLFYIMLPLIMIDGFVATWGALLNAHKLFLVPALAQGIIPLIIIILLYLYGRQLGTYSLAIGTTIGTAAVALVLIFRLKLAKINLIPKWHGYSQNVKNTIWSILPLLAGNSISYSSSLIDQSMAAMLGNGSVAAMGYANKLVMAPLTIVVTAIGAVIMPYASQAVAEKNWLQLKWLASKYLIILIGGSLVFSVMLYLLAMPIIKLFFQRGSFTIDDSMLVHHIMAFFIIQIPFYISATFLIKILMALKRTKLIMSISINNAFFNIVLNYVLMQYLGVAGIALSTSIVWILTFIWTYIAVKLQLNRMIKLDGAIK